MVSGSSHRERMGTQFRGLLHTAAASLKFDLTAALLEPRLPDYAKEFNCHSEFVPLSRTLFPTTCYLQISNPLLYGALSSYFWQLSPLILHSYFWTLLGKLRDGVVFRPAVERNLRLSWNRTMHIQVYEPCYTESWLLYDQKHVMGCPGIWVTLLLCGPII